MKAKGELGGLGDVRENRVASLDPENIRVMEYSRELNQTS